VLPGCGETDSRDSSESISGHLLHIQDIANLFFFWYLFAIERRRLERCGDSTKKKRERKLTGPQMGRRRTEKRAEKKKNNYFFCRNYQLLLGHQLLVDEEGKTTDERSADDREDDGDGDGPCRQTAGRVEVGKAEDDRVGALDVGLGEEVESVDDDAAIVEVCKHTQTQKEV